MNNAKFTLNALLVVIMAVCLYLIAMDLKEDKLAAEKTVQ